VLISKANSLAEVQRLEKALNEGRLPAGFATDDDAMDET
jgi:U2 small nuclear ribonucleoprotein A'